MTIRPMLPEDYDLVCRLWLSCPGLALNNLDDSREGIARFLRRNPDICLAAEEDGELVGVILTGYDGRRGYIYHTAVRPDRQGQGIGAALVRATMEALRAMGVTKCALIAFADNESGNAFWEKQGFHLRSDIVYRDYLLNAFEKIIT